MFDSELLGILTEKVRQGSWGTRLTASYPKKGWPWLAFLFRDPSSGQTPRNKDCPTFREQGCLTQPPRACEQTYRPAPSTVFTPFSPQAAPDVSQLPQECVQHVHNAYSLDTIVRQSAGVGGVDVASWVGIPGAALAGLGHGRTWCLWYTEGADKTLNTVDREMMDLGVVVCMGLEGI